MPAPSILSRLFLFLLAEPFFEDLIIGPVCFDLLQRLIHRRLQFFIFFLHCEDHAVGALGGADDLQVFVTALLQVVHADRLVDDNRIKRLSLQFHECLRIRVELLYLCGFGFLRELHLLGADLRADILAFQICPVLDIIIVFSDNDDVAILCEIGVGESDLLFTFRRRIEPGSAHRSPWT